VEIGFQSEPGVGSRFWFTVPMKESPGNAPGPVTPVSQPAPEPVPDARRILLAEDNAVNREVLTAMLHQLGYQADQVENGYEAWCAVETARYDLVLMDCQMPEMDGYEAIRRIRDRPAGALNAGIAVVAVTASAMAGDRDKCMQAGMDDYLSKPIEPEQLARVLNQWMNGRNAGRRPPDSDSAPAAETCIFDEPSLIKRVMGNRKLAGKIVGAFLESAPAQLSNLRSQTAKHDGPSARREAHSLKGAAATISAPALRDVALKAEQAAAAEQWELVAALIPSLEAQLERLREALSACEYVGP
jgi:CheY-like chemotaxis protein/HPt (histidine-containing phosphotransfer) domain-containing protein